MTDTLPGVPEGEEDESCYDQPGQPSQHVGGPPAPATHISPRDVDTCSVTPLIVLSLPSIAIIAPTEDECEAVSVVDSPAEHPVSHAAVGGREHLGYQGPAHRPTHRQTHRDQHPV